MRSKAARIIALGLLVAASPARAAYLPLEEIPTESSLYSELEDLASRYGTPSGFLQTRPWTLGMARAFLHGLESSGCDCAQDPAFLRVRREVGPEAGGQPPLVRSATDTAAVEFSPYLRFGYDQDPARAPTVVRDYRIGGAAAADLRGGLLMFMDYYAATYSPEPHGNPIGGTRFAVVEGVDVNAWFDRAYVAAGTRSLTGRAGHTWLRWGPGRSGTLGLSDGSLALDLAEARWLILPPVQLTWFVAWLDVLNEQYLAGHRLELRPGRSLGFGLSELARFNGSAQVPQYLIPLVDYNKREKQIVHFSDASRDTDQAFSKNNVLYTADAWWKIAPGVLAYGEVVADDFSFSSVYRPNEIGYQLGGRLSRRVGTRDAAGARLEFTRIYNFTYSTWHKHDFESDGYPLVYPLGPDVQVLLGELQWSRGPDWTFGFQATSVRKGEGRIGVPWQPDQGEVDNAPLSGVVERTTRAAVSAAFSPGRRLRLEGRVGHATAKNLGHSRGLSARGWSGSSALTLRW